MAPLLLSTVAALLVAAPLDEAAQAIALVDSVAAALKDAPAIAFETRIKTKVQTVEVAQKAKVLLARPDRARIELSGAGQDALIVLDGAKAWHYLKAKRGFVESKQLGFQKLEAYGAGPMAQLFFAQGVGALRPYLAEARVTEEPIDQRTCSVIQWNVGTEENRVWIADARLLRCRTTRSIAGNVFEQTVEFGAINAAPAVAPDAFVFVPPPGSQPLGKGDEEGFLAVGTVAPEFVATRLDGTVLRSAEVAGRPLLLTFWFHGCAPCREELPRLQELNEEYAPRGLVMLAVNYGDEPATIAAYFEKAGFTFTPLRQQQDEVSAAFGVRSYPSTYVIGADGRIAWRELGFDEASLRAALDRVTPAK